MIMWLQMSIQKLNSGNPSLSLQEEVIKMDLRERRVSKDMARDRLAWKSIF